MTPAAPPRAPPPQGGGAAGVYGVLDGRRDLWGGCAGWGG